MEKREIIRLSAALLLSMVMLFPAIVQFSHTFQDHDHPVCTDQQAHIHQEVQDCDICHFHQSPYNYEIASYSGEFQEEIFKDFVGKTADPVLSTKFQYLPLRAPPASLG